MLFFVFSSHVTAYTSTLEETLGRRTMFQTKLDEIVTDYLMKRERKPVKDEFLRRYGQVSETH